MRCKVAQPHTPTSFSCFAFNLSGGQCKRIVEKGLCGTYAHTHIQFSFMYLTIYREVMFIDCRHFDFNAIICGNGTFEVERLTTNNQQHQQHEKKERSTLHCTIDPNEC